MDLSRIKKIVKQNGDKVILVENDEPEMVMMSFAEYEKLTSGKAMPAYRREQDEDVRIEEAGFRETEFVTPGISGMDAPRLRTEEVRLEDLPI